MHKSDLCSNNNSAANDYHSNIGHWALVMRSSINRHKSSTKRWDLTMVNSNIRKQKLNCQSPIIIDAFKLQVKLISLQLLEA